MRTAVYPINEPKRVLPMNTQLPRKDKGRAYSDYSPPRVITDKDGTVRRYRGTTRRIVQ